MGWSEVRERRVKSEAAVGSVRPLAWQGGYGLDLSMRTLYKGCPRLRQGVRGQLEDLRSQGQQWV